MSQSLVDRSKLANLTFVVGKGPQAKRIPVIRDIARLASPVWFTLLDPTKGSQSEISFPDDDPYSLEIILAAVHLENHLLPKQIRIPQALTLASAIDKYDTLAAVRPLTEELIETEKFRKVLSQTHEGIFISWTLGMSGLFKEITRVVILESKSDPDGTLRWKNDRRLGELVTPANFIEDVKAARTQAMEEIVALVFRHAELAMTTKCPKADLDCEIMKAGMATKLLLKLGWWPRFPQAKDIRSSIAEIYGHILKEEMHVFNHTRGSYSSDAPCNVIGNLQSELTDRYSKISFAMMDAAYETHLTIQRNKGRPKPF